MSVHPQLLINGILGAWEFRPQSVHNDVGPVQKAVVKYHFNGIKHIQQGQKSSARTWDEFATFQILKELEKQGLWEEARDLREEQI